MMRKLVTVRRVGAIKPIQGADRIEVAAVDGWKCVVQKGDFNEDDLGVFFEIDSFLPAEDDRWAHLSGNFIQHDGRRGLRIKTLKLRSQVSQGLLMPLIKFPEIKNHLDQLENHNDKGTALTRLMDMSFEDVLKVTKYEKPEGNREAGVDFYGGIPPFINRTEQYRCQNLRDLFNDWGGGTFQETVKMDGSSMTVYFILERDPNNNLLAPLNLAGGKAGAQANGRVGVCSKNKDLIEKERNLFWDVAKAHDLPAKLSALDRNIAIQGELCGSSIQANFEGFPAGFHDFYLYSVWDIDMQKYLPPKETEQWAADLGVSHVPVNGYFKLNDIATNTDELVKRADGTGINGKKREGLVFKHIGGGFSFKAISNSYLLKHGE
jgi:RNA ligase (TIGR02306 family)